LGRQDVVSYLLEHKNSAEANPKCQYDVVSSESLRIDSAGSVNLLVAALTYLLYPDDAIARAQLAYEYARLHDPEKPMAAVFATANPAVFESSLPGAFTERKNILAETFTF